VLIPSLFWQVLLGISTVLSFSACGKKVASSDTTKHVSVPTGFTGTKHFDIPTPLTFTALSTSTSTTGSSMHDAFRYGGMLPIGPTIAFYKREMERNGWDIVDLSDTQEGFLYCSKPTKVCGIAIRTQKAAAQPTLVTLFIQQEA